MSVAGINAVKWSLLSRLLRPVATIRGQILLAFLLMTGITAIVGLHASYHIERGGRLVTETYDRSLMAINYARGASTDFALMQLIALRYANNPDEASRAHRDQQLGELRQSLSEDLAIAAERSQSPRAADAAARAQAAIDVWDRTMQQGFRGISEDADLLRQAVQDADREVDLLINYTAGDGFRYGRRARAAVTESWWLNLCALIAAFLVSALIAQLLARRIVGRVSTASSIAEQIAKGHLDGTLPRDGQDELGALLNSLATMRENLRDMMGREVAQRQSAQGRLLDALESSHEGIVVVGRDDRVILANNQALSALEWGDAATRGATAVAVTGTIWSQLSAKFPGVDVQGKAQMPGGRWLKVSRSPTREGGFVAIMSDVTALMDQETRLEATNLRLDTALDNMSQGLCLFDDKGRLAVVNNRYSEIFHLPPGCARLGLTIRELIALRIEHGNHPGYTAEELAVEKLTMVERRKPTSIIMHIAGNRVLSVSLRPAPNGGWAATYEDVTQRHHAERQVMFMARHDGLTQLPNRILFTERLQQALLHLDGPHGFAVLCLDLDRFKEVNDTFGHAKGDLLLRIVGERLSGCVRKCDTISRLGGDEFAVIQIAPKSNEETLALAQRIIEAVGAPYDLDGQRAVIGVSIGVACVPADGVNADTVMRNADIALYRAKADGRGTCRFFEPEMDAHITDRLALSNDLREALSRGEFEVRYQPVYDLKLDRIAGFEALLRWHHPTRGPVPPSEFIPLAEELGLIVSLGTWVLRQACLEAAQWPDYVHLAVNVSAVQFRLDQFVPTVKDALYLSGLPASRLCLEVTETVLLAKNLATLETMQFLRAMGVRLSLDDFGTGYSSLSYLVSFPIDQIKIDQSFVCNLGETDSGMIVRAIISLAGSLGMRVVAEGVETIEQLQWLRDERCDDVQGYLLAPPLLPYEVPEVIKRQRSYQEATTATPVLVYVEGHVES